MEIFNQHDLDGNVSLNNVAHSSGYIELSKSISPANYHSFKQTV